MERYDFIVIGGGGAGLNAAHSVRAANKKVAVIDPMPIGGLCALKGCNPKKVLVRATEVLHLVQSALEHGVRTGEVRFSASIPNQPAQQESCFTSLVNVCAASFRPSTMVR